ncbi:MAG: hypothetical protein M1828_005114 [Chrysothrix sp. TS-e1954]|nr:MAG: hypothetical protein M1828_005114 [Chrysothrix sp. TS-e1954]
MSANVPKFSSFHKPKSSEETRSHREEKPHAGSSLPKRSHHHPRTTDPSAVSGSPTIPSERQPDLKQGPSFTVFFTDRHGDPNVAVYGRNDGAKTPAYRSTPDWLTLGGTLKASSTGSERSPLSTLGEEQRSRLLSDTVQPRWLQTRPERSHEAQDDYVPLEAENPESSNRGTPDLGAEEDQEEDDTKSYQPASTIGVWLLDIFCAGKAARSDNSGQREACYRLRCAKTEIGEQLWEPTALLKAWDEAIERHPSQLVWLKYLEFKQHHTSHFRFEDCVKSFQRYFDNLRAKPSGSSIKIDSLLRCSDFLRQAGYQENAIAIWQANFETTIFRPGHLSSFTDVEHRETVLRAFEEFWDSEVPRIGELGSKGWRNSNLRELSSNDLDNNTSEKAHSPPARRWDIAEGLAAEHCSRPGRTSDREDLGDPFHVILTDDLLPFLYTESIESESIGLVNAFLSFCGLPLLPSSRHVDAKSGQGHVTNVDESLAKPSPRIRYRATCNDQLQTLHSCAMTDEMLFSPVDYFEALHPWSLTFRTAYSTVDINLLINILMHVCAAMPQYPPLLHYALALESSLDPHRARRHAKSLLKSSPNATHLYAIFAWIERQCNGTEKADRFLITAVSALDKQSEIGGSSIIHLWRTLIVQSLQSGHEAKLLRALASINSKSPEDVFKEHWHPEYAALVKSKEILEGGAITALCSHSPDQTLHFAECLAILTYATTTDLESTSEVIHHHLGKMQTSCSLAAIEALHQTQAQIVAYHLSRHRPYSPLQARSILQYSIDRFPSNSLLRMIYLSVGPNIMLEDRVRPALGDSTSSVDDTMLLCSLLIDLQPDRVLGTINSRRNKFEQICSKSAGKNNVLLWTCRVLNECETGDLQLAKQLFLRGLAILPGAKSFALLAFSHLHEVMNREELKGVYETMCERGLRICVDFNDKSAYDDTG